MYRCTGVTPWDHRGRSCPIYEVATSPAYAPTLGRGGTWIGESWVQNAGSGDRTPHRHHWEGVAGPSSRVSGGRAGGGDRMDLSVSPTREEST